MQNESRPNPGPSRWLCVLSIAAGVLLAQPAAAFTIEGGGGEWATKFDLEEQARQFRSPGMSSLTDSGTANSSTNRSGLYFGTSPGSSPFGYEDRSRATRDHYNRMFDPSYQFNSR